MKSKTDQIRQVHAGFIHAVVRAVASPHERGELEQALSMAQANGWTDVVEAVRGILAGRRDAALLGGLDEEDHAIVSGILEGLRDPATLPDPSAKADAALAAPGLANMIHLAARGNVEALRALASMGEQMSAGGGDMAQLAGRFRVLINGERDADVLSDGLGAKSRALMLSILEELGKLDTH